MLEDITKENHFSGWRMFSPFHPPGNGWEPRIVIIMIIITVYLSVLVL